MENPIDLVVITILSYRQIKLYNRIVDLNSWNRRNTKSYFINWKKGKFWDF